MSGSKLSEPPSVVDAVRFALQDLDDVALFEGDFVASRRVVVVHRATEVGEAAGNAFK